MGQQVCGSCGHENEEGSNYCEQCGVPLADDAALGEELLGGRYILERCIGEGGMGRVYLGHIEGEPSRKVAIKVLHDHMLKKKEAVRRFKREATLMERLDHPNLMPIIECVEDDHAFAIVMPYFEGGTLRDLIDRGPTEAKDLEASLKLFKKVLAALEVLHAKGVVHRDLKPSNIMLTEDGQPVLCDLGVASVATEGTKLTKTYQQIGTAFYMAPEQHRGMPASSASDVYAAGMILFELVTGKEPFNIEAPAGFYEIAAAHMQQTPALGELQGQARALAPLLERALEKEPEARFADAKAFARALNPMFSYMSSDLDGAFPWEDDDTNSLNQGEVLLWLAAHRKAITAVIFASLLAVILFVAWPEQATLIAAGEANDFGHVALGELERVHLKEAGGFAVLLGFLMTALSLSGFVGTVLMIVRLYHRYDDDARSRTETTLVFRGARKRLMGLLFVVGATLLLSGLMFSSAVSDKDYSNSRSLGLAKEALEQAEYGRASDLLDTTYSGCLRGRLVLYTGTCRHIFAAKTNASLAQAINALQQDSMVEYERLLDGVERDLSTKPDYWEDNDDDLRSNLELARGMSGAKLFADKKYEQAAPLLEEQGEFEKAVFAYNELGNMEKVCALGTASAHPELAVNACLKENRLDRALELVVYADKATLTRVFDVLRGNREWGLMCALSLNTKEAKEAIESCKASKEWEPLLVGLAEMEEESALATLLDELVEARNYGLVCSYGDAHVEPARMLESCEEAGNYMKVCQLHVLDNNRRACVDTMNKLVKAGEHMQVCLIGSATFEPELTAQACEKAGELQRAFELLDEAGMSRASSALMKRLYRKGVYKAVCQIGSIELEPAMTANACSRSDRPQRAVELYEELGQDKRAAKVLEDYLSAGEYEVVCDLGSEQRAPFATAKACEEIGEHRRAANLYKELEKARDLDRLFAAFIERNSAKAACGWISLDGFSSVSAAKVCERGGEEREALELYKEAGAFSDVGRIYEDWAAGGNNVTYLLEGARAYARARQRTRSRSLYTRALPTVFEHRAVEQYIEVQRARGEFAKGLDMVVEWVTSAEAKGELHEALTMVMRLNKGLISLDERRSLSRSELLTAGKRLEELDKLVERALEKLELYPEMTVDARAILANEVADRYEYIVIDGVVHNDGDQAIQSVTVVFEFFEPKDTARDFALDAEPEAGLVKTLKLENIEPGEKRRFEHTVDTQTPYQTFSHHFTKLVLSE